jgi:hypothetical protein
MRAIKINAEAQTVTEIDLPSGDESAIGGALNCGKFSHATTYANDDLLLIGASEPLSGTEAFFEIEVGPHGITRLICGNGIILGSLPDGEKVGARTPLLALRVIRVCRPALPARAHGLPSSSFRSNHAVSGRCRSCRVLYRRTFCILTASAHV